MALDQVSNVLSAIEKAPAATVSAGKRVLPRPIPTGKAVHAECVVQQGDASPDALSRQTQTIKELLAALSIIANSTARPSDELSALARNTLAKYVRP